jgi:hypothetical protein
MSLAPGDPSELFPFCHVIPCTRVQQIADLRPEFIRSRASRRRARRGVELAVWSGVRIDFRIHTFMA